jgi:simple sugar transport system ATP-binding protein
MRRGAVVATLGGAAATPEALARAMVGRPVLGRVDKRPAAPAEPVLEVHGLHARGPGGTPMVRGVSFLVHAGEIVGIAGVVGNGQSELLEVIAGLRPAEAGRVVLGGQEITGKSPRERQARGMGHIPEDRHARGLLLPLPLTDNVLLGRVAEFSSPLAVHRDALAKFTRSLIEEFDVHPADPDYPAAALSGGNQQKLIVGRELTRPRPVLLLCGQPTRGVDIGAIELIHRQIVSARDRGLGILLFSTELEELRALADRVLVMYKGRIVASLRGEELHSAEGLERVGGLMTGAIAGEVAA